MWNLEFLGVDLYHILACFWVYSFFGWIWETSYVSIKNRRFVNRGFVEGPVLTIYGTGATTVYLILRPLEGRWLLVYVCGMLVATVLEYVTGVLMEVVFHTSWWDYSDKKWNFQGKVCLGSSLMWGVFSVVLFVVFQPVVNGIVDFPPKPVGELLVTGVTVLYAVDCGMSVAAAIQIGEKLRTLEQFRESFSAYLQNTRIRKLAEVLRERMSVSMGESPERMRQYLMERRQAFSDLLDQYLAGEDEQTDQPGYLERLAGYSAEKRDQFLAGLAARREGLKQEMMAQFDRFVGSYGTGKQFQDHAAGRYFRAYPHLQRSFLRRLETLDEEPEKADRTVAPKGAGDDQ